MATFSDKIRIRLRAYDYRVLDQSTTEIVDTARRTGARLAGPIPAPDRHEQVDRVAFAARRQEVPGAVRDSDPQAADRHLRADAADRGCADEARSAGGRRRRDQGVRQGARLDRAVSRNRAMVSRILGRKIGMTQVFDPNGRALPATVLTAGPCVRGAAQDGGAGRLRRGAARARRRAAGAGDEAACGALPEVGRGSGAGEAQRRFGRSPSSKRRRATRCRTATRLRVASLFAAGDQVDVVRREPRTRVPGRHEASRLRRRPGHARIDVSPRARLDRAVVLAVARAEGDAGAGPHGRRPGDRAQSARHPGGRREQPAGGERRGAGGAGRPCAHSARHCGRAASRAAPVQDAASEEEEAQLMTLDVVNRQNEKVGSIDLDDETFGGPVDAGLVMGVRRAGERGRTARHAQHEDPRRGERDPAGSRGGRRAPAVPASARSATRCGARAARHSVRGPAATPMRCRRRSCAGRCGPR